MIRKNGWSWTGAQRLRFPSNKKDHYYRGCGRWSYFLGLIGIARWLVPIGPSGFIVRIGRGAAVVVVTGVETAVLLSCPQIRVDAEGNTKPVAGRSGRNSGGGPPFSVFALVGKIACGGGGSVRESRVTGNPVPGEIRQVVPAVATPAVAPLVVEGPSLVEVLIRMAP